MSDDNKNKIEDIKMRLYDPNDKVMSHQKEGVLHKIDHDVPKEWKDDEIIQKDNMNHKSKKSHGSIIKSFFIFSIIFFLGALGFAYYKFTNNDVSVSGDKIDINIIGNAFTKGGEDLPLQIEITNNNTANLELVNLFVEYPKGAEDNNIDVVRLPKEVIGTIAPGENVIRNIKVKLFGEEKSIRNIKISLEYHPEGSNAIFTKDKFYPVTISLAPLSLIIESPTTTTSNQLINFKVTATLNTSLPNENSVLQLTYPNNFEFDSATPSPIIGNSIWDLSTISPTNPITVEVKGRLIGQDGDEQVFHAYAGTTNGTDQSVLNVVYSSVLQKVLISKPFLEANILVNGQDLKEYAVSGGEEVEAGIYWANNLSTRITDCQIIVGFSGNVYNKNGVNPKNGFYDSANNQIIWDKNSIPELAEINPGEKGTIAFSFKPISLIGLTNISSPQVSLKVSIRGREPLTGTTFNEINNFSEKLVKILSDFQIAGSASYSSGSMPPKAETETKYIITWTLANSSNRITGATARASLPIYVKWAGLLSNSLNENVTYNEVTREVTWNIGSVNPNTGINSNREASFIVTLSPSISQVGSVPQLVKDIYLSGTDSFTNTLIKSTKGPVTTMLTDPGFLPVNGRVIQ